MAGSGPNRRGPGHHKRSGPDQDRDDVLRAGPDLSVPNPDCPTTADCTAHPAALTRPVYFISTYRFWDPIIASPATDRAFFLSTSAHPALGIILSSDGKPADHTSIQNPHTRPGRFVRLGHGPAGIPTARQPDCGRLLYPAASGAGLEHQLARQRHQVSWERAAKVPGPVKTGNPANGETARSRHRTPGSGKPRIAPADSTIPRIALPPGLVGARF
jgi:hypothetical protein